MTSRPILPTPLVSTDRLAKHLGDPDLRVLDAPAHPAGPESGSTGRSLRPIADEGVPIRGIAEVIGRHLDVPVVSIPADQASEHFGFLAGFLAADNPASSTLIRELLGWQPAHPWLIDDLDKGHYFHSRPAKSAEPGRHHQSS